MASDRRRRLLLVLAIVATVLLAGCTNPLSSPSREAPSSDGTGNLTVEVVNEDNGEPVVNREVTIRSKDTGNKVFEAPTDARGRISTELELGHYRIIADHTTDTVEVIDDGRFVRLEVAVSPPNTEEGATWTGPART